MEGMPALLSILSLFGYFLGLLLVYAGLAKLRGVERLRLVLAAVGKFPFWLICSAAWFIPLAEIATGAGMLLGYAAAKAAAVVLFLSFFAFSLEVLRQKISVTCNCFGQDSGEAISRRTVGRALIFAVLAALSLAGNATAAAPLDVAGCLMAVGAILLSRQLIWNVTRLRELRRVGTL